MIRELWLIGIGTGSPNHITLEGQAAIRDAAVILLPLKGDEKDDLAAIRRDIIAAADTNAKVVEFEYPTRDPNLPYQDRVAAWHDEIARRWQTALATEAESGPVALLVWGDPSLYDSTIRISSRLAPAPLLRVFPGITAIQALTAAHCIPLNTIDGTVHITTGRNLRRDRAVPRDASVVVMLDGECSFQHLINAESFHIWWGAYLGSPHELLMDGRLSDVSHDIIKTRARAREKHGWIMDCYLLRRA